MDIPVNEGQVSLLDTTEIQVNEEQMNLLDTMEIRKMTFLYNALENGWAIKKKGKDCYSCTKNHEGKKEVFLEADLKRWVKEGFNIKNILD